MAHNANATHVVAERQDGTAAHSAQALGGCGGRRGASLGRGTVEERREDSWLLLQRRLEQRRQLLRVLKVDMVAKELDPGRGPKEGLGDEPVIRRDPLDDGRVHASTDERRAQPGAQRGALCEVGAEYGRDEALEASEAIRLRNKEADEREDLRRARLRV